jgi:hypothetical protein
VNVERTIAGAAAGAAAAAVWAAQQPLDKRLFRSDYDDVELLGKLVTRGSDWPVAGLALHLQNGALFGAGYVQAKPYLPGPPLARAVLAAMAENFAFWPLGRLVDRFHPAREELEPFHGNLRALAQATWRHLIFGLVLGALEERLSITREDEPPPIPSSSNGHGNIEAAVSAA